VTSTDLPELDGVAHRFVDVRGARLHVAEIGSGPPVVLLHGWPQHWWTWRGVMPLLADRFRVIAIDLRGFGWSEATPRGYYKAELAEDVVGVLDALGLERVCLVGHDWGGVIGFIICLEHPERVERFVPMSTGHVWPKAGWRLVTQVGAFAYQSLLGSPGLGHRVGASPRVLQTVFKLISTQSDAVLAEFDCFAPRFAEPARARAVQQVYSTFAFHEYPAWLRGRFADHRLTQPALWLQGERDPAIQRRAIEDVTEHADDLRIEYLPDCGHFPPDERPDLVARELREFFAPSADA
jgi:pimeloyl-ACP methyl ester carboxylesterase